MPRRERELRVLCKESSESVYTARCTGPACGTGAIVGRCLDYLILQNLRTTGCLHVVVLLQSLILLLFQECGDKAGLRKLIEKPVYNTIAIANLFKKALKPLLAAEEKISATLVHLYCMAVEFLDQPMTVDEMKAAFDSARSLMQRIMTQ